MPAAGGFKLGDERLDFAFVDGAVEILQLRLPNDLGSGGGRLQRRRSGLRKTIAGQQDGPKQGRGKGKTHDG